MQNAQAAFDLAGTIIDKLAFRRRLLRLTPFDAARKRSAVSRRLGFASPPLENPHCIELTETMNSGCAFIMAEPAFLTPEARALLEALIAAGPDAWTWKDGQPTLESEDILTTAPSLYRLGLDDMMLTLAENYLGEPCYYLGCCLKREKVSAAAIGTRQWHTDVEDDRMLRLIVYLNDVEEGGGPMEYIDAAHTAAARDMLGYRSGFVSDSDMRSVVPEACWNRVVGRAGTVIAFDGARFFHRASPPILTDRFSVTFTFTSRHPKQIWRPVRLRPDSRRRLLASLPERQAACIPLARWG